jgi:hypothetical protein
MKKRKSKTHLSVGSTEMEERGKMFWESTLMVRYQVWGGIGSDCGYFGL